MSSTGSGSSPSSLSVTPAERARVDQIDRLVAAGDGNVTELLNQLSDPSWTVRRSVVGALAVLGDAAVPGLVHTLRHERSNETVVAATVDALVASTGDVETALEPLTKDPAQAVVADVAQVLGRRQRPSSVPTLVALSSHPDDNVAVGAIEALGRVGGRAAVEPLLNAVHSGNFFRVFPAIDVLGRSGDPRAVPPLAALLGNRHYALEAARALGRTADLHAIAPLAKLLSAGSLADARVAALALTDLTNRFRERYGAVEPVEDGVRASAQAATAVRRLAQALRDADANERVAISGVLGLLRDEAAVPLLTALLSDAAPGVAAAAAASLQDFGRHFEPAVAHMLVGADSPRRKLLLPLTRSSTSAREVAMCLDDEDPEVRVMACDALARIGNTAVVPALFQHLTDSNPAAVQAAVGAIQALGGPETEALALTAARSPVAEVRRWSLRILAYFGSAAALDVCLAGLADKDPRVRDSAIFGLPFIEDPRARDALLETGKSAVPRMRAAAVRALGECPGDARVQAALLRALTDVDPWVRYYACQSLGRIAAEPAVESMVRLLGDDAGQVRIAAIEALSVFKSQVAEQALMAAATGPDPDGDVRRAALVGLGIQRRPQSLPILAEAVRSPDTATRLVALAGLAGYDGPEATQALGGRVLDPDEGVRNAAIGFLAGRRGPEVTALLVGLVRQQPGSRRLHEALAMPSPDRIRGLMTELAVADDELAPLLTSALARMHRPDAYRALVQALELPHLPARKAAATSLGGIGTREALDALRHSAAHDASSEVRQICALVLA